MERAVRALAGTLGGDDSRLANARATAVVQRLARLSAADPDAFAAVLAECGVIGTTEAVTEVWLRAEGLFACREGHAVLEGRVVELEEADAEFVACTVPSSTVAHRCAYFEPRYRVKQHTEVE
jgi:hypothetical protein